MTEYDELVKEQERLLAENNELKRRIDYLAQWRSVEEVRFAGKLLNGNALWVPLDRYSREHGYVTKEEDNVNYGTVKTYHADVWLKVYGIQI